MPAFYACGGGRVFPTRRRVVGWLLEICETDRLCTCGDGHCFDRRDCRSGQPEPQGETRRALEFRVKGAGAGNVDAGGASRRAHRHQPGRCPGAAAGTVDGRGQEGCGNRRAPAHTRPVSPRRGSCAGEGDRDRNRRTESTADHRRQPAVARGSGTRIGTGANRTQAMTTGLSEPAGRWFIGCGQEGRDHRPSHGCDTNHQDGGITDLWKGLRYKQDRGGRVQDATPSPHRRTRGVAAGRQGRDDCPVRHTVVSPGNFFLCARLRRGDGVAWGLPMEWSHSGCPFIVLPCRWRLP